jgi:signal transduction histidine kinase
VVIDDSNANHDVPLSSKAHDRIFRWRTGMPMNLLVVITRRPVVFVRALLVVLATVLMEELAYQTASPMLGRVGVVILGAMSFLALAHVMRHSLALEQRQRELKRLLQAERDRLEIEVRERTAQLTELAHHLQTAREDERGRLARDLHDELGALLTSAKLDAARMKARLAGSAPEVLERLAHLVQTLDTVIALKRRIVEDLRPSALTHLGLVATLEILAREFAEVSGLEVHVTLDPVHLDSSAELVAYRFVQEAFTNIAKHARACQVWVCMEERDGKVDVSVRDDGAGFDGTAQPVSAHGLLGMRYRIEAAHGTLGVSSSPGQGALVQMCLPQALQPCEPCPTPDPTLA